jgi:hypothetical protein
MQVESHEKFWRIRVKADIPMERVAWKRNEVGIWYGGWRADDYNAAMHTSSRSPADVANFLGELPQHKNNVMHWHDRTGAVSTSISKGAISTVRRFWDIKETDWVYVYFDEALHFARVCSEARSDDHHELNHLGELFKFRTIRDKKDFTLDKLPDSFRLLPSAGRSNVYEVHGTNRKLVELLAHSKNEEQASSEIALMPWRDWLAILGPGGWESLCLGYLILEEGFVPTGLDVGRTLKTFDIVGRNRDGQRILAQCKKDLSPAKLDDEFLTAALHSTSEDKYFYFAYGGLTGEIPHKISVLTGIKIEGWLDATPKGSWYRQVLR